MRSFGLHVLRLWTNFQKKVSFSSNRTAQRYFIFFWPSYRASLNVLLRLGNPYVQLKIKQYRFIGLFNYYKTLFFILYFAFTQMLLSVHLFIAKKKKKLTIWKCNTDTEYIKHLYLLYLLMLFSNLPNYIDAKCV